MMKCVVCWCSVALTLTCMPNLQMGGNAVLAQEFSAQQANPVADFLKPGDRVRLTVVGFPELSGEQAIAGDGSIQLPLAGSIAIAGLNLSQASNRISEALIPYVRRPQVGLVVVSVSPLRINVTGEVIQPGPRSLNLSDPKNIVPATLSGALFLAGGVTPDADLRRIIIRRAVPEGAMAANSASDDANERSILLFPQNASPPRSEIQVDLWQALQDGNLSADPRIYDGDEIIVPTAFVSSVDQQIILSSTVAPASIIVRVAGEVQRPGQIEISPDAGPSEAVAAAGGFTDDADPEALAVLRMSPEGRLEPIEFTFGEASEPLKNGDLIVVGQSTRGTVGTFFDFLGRVFDPFGVLFRIFGN